MELNEALAIANEEYLGEEWGQENEAAIIEEQACIRASEAHSIITETNMEMIDKFPVKEIVECSVAMGIRFGMRVQRTLQSANAEKPKPTNEPVEERQRQNE